MADDGRSELSKKVQPETYGVQGGEWVQVSGRGRQSGRNQGHFLEEGAASEQVG